MASLAVCALLVANPAAVDAGGERARGGERRAGGGVRRVRATPGPAWVKIPAGTFTMGASDSERQSREAACVAEVGTDLSLCARDSFLVGRNVVPDEREVTLSAYLLARTEATVGDYRACVRAGACPVAPLLVIDVSTLADDVPIVAITWDEARAYCLHAGGRLPTEAEWEKAARGPGARRWPWGRDDELRAANLGRTLPQVLWPPFPSPIAYQVQTRDADGSDGSYGLAPVGSHPRGASPYGALDMIGNAAEWVEDGFAIGYENLPSIDPVRPLGREGVRVFRGGGWRSPRFIATTYVRDGASSGDRSNDRGVRCARDP